MIILPGRVSLKITTREGLLAGFIFFNEAYANTRKLIENIPCSSLPNLAGLCF